MKLILVLLLPLMAGAVQAAGDIEAGKGKTGTCVACHGAEGVSPNLGRRNPA